MSTHISRREKSDAECQSVSVNATTAFPQTIITVSLADLPRRLAAHRTQQARGPPFRLASCSGSSLSAAESPPFLIWTAKPFGHRAAFCQEGLRPPPTPFEPRSTENAEASAWQCMIWAQGPLLASIGFMSEALKPAVCTSSET
ncbi:hypothetical protein NDA11_005693 [Ustilago hordei]|uniref:Uncharacterized protein n=1 Tax=Ustilago hordei TaxID=120017 RepID=I2FU35_USTHO|nr:uncharacterized protein UHO2_07449 [Ustilago hordei]KAJ1043088.1 hypothetical protein NDA10_006224 [Ustilago hordei]KAJ1573143.1 hypothetical protein NDA12_007073 [Ustilago hordei]KAJ1577598.1 hypothetical protein NDA11_005693 [Ustilago hordei]KAJ1582208.1 hypothetical protein NDA15_005371 [Ustilago hordei]KAJ1597702.1 hypothetical protein NDA14_001397 [Ustilago hordei]